MGESALPCPECGTRINTAAFKILGDGHHWKGSCRYWTSSLYTRRPCFAMMLDDIGEDKTERYMALSIRPVTK